MSTLKKILITGTGSLIGQAIIKSLQKSKYCEEWNLIGCDYFPNTVGSFWCEKNYILPDILKEDMTTEWRKAIFEIVQENQIKIIYVGVDFELLEFEKMKEDLFVKFQCTVVVSSRETLEIGNDKYRTYEFLRDNDLNYPNTCIVEDINMRNMNYPCILKPRIGARSKGVYTISSETELIEKSKLLENGIVQELIGTAEQEYTCGVICLEGELIASIALKRTLKEGNTFFAEYRKDYPIAIYEYIESIAKELNICGSCNFQLRLNEKQEPVLFEINPRFSGTTYMRTLFGFNEVECITKWILDRQHIQFNLHEGQVIRYYDEKLIGEL